MNKNKKNIIKPRTLKGFRDFYGADAHLRQYVVGIFRQVFESYGYEPLETPTLEYADILLGKSGNEMDQLCYTFTDQGKREVGMKYDMTVPTCRFVAQNKNSLIFRFKRYQIQLAWRAENTQKGRFREFMQCDADVWGLKSVLVDAEFIQMGIEATLALGFKDFVARINNRKIVDGLLRYCGATKNKYYDIAISVDKLEKIGPKGVEKELTQRNIDKKITEKILDFILPQSQNETSQNLLNNAKDKLKNDSRALEGIQEIKTILSYLKNTGVNSKYYQYDPSIIRGMAYYTGPIWEFTVKEGGVGSIAGCGRYDNLTGLYTGQDIPASGGSFGIERIIEVIKDRKMINFNQPTTQILVTIFSQKLKEKAFILAKKLRQASINTELFLNPKGKLSKQFKYASQKDIPYIAVIGPDEAKNKTITIKNMKTGKQETLSLQKLLKKLSKKNIKR